MTREEAIEYLEKDIKLHEVFNDKAIEALNMAIEALEQEPCDDCIWFRQGIQRTRRGYAYERKTER